MSNWELSRRYGDQMGRLELEGAIVFSVQLMQSDLRRPATGDAATIQLGHGLRDAAAERKCCNLHTGGVKISEICRYSNAMNVGAQENLTILGFTDLLDRIFSNNWLPVVVVRRLGLWMLRRILQDVYSEIDDGIKGRTLS